MPAPKVRTVILVVGLLVALGASAVLGVALLQTRQDVRAVNEKLDSSRAELQRQVSAGEDQLSQEIASAETRLQAIADTAASRVPDVSTLRSDLDDLETSLFGLSGPRFERDIVGSLKRQIQSLEFDTTRLQSSVSSLKLCVNGAFQTMDRNFRELLAYVVRTLAGGFAVLPTTVTPVC